MQAISTATSGTSQPASAEPRLVKAAHEFEAQMMKELLKPMTGKDALTGEDGKEEDSYANGALGDFASEALGQALSSGGGFGIAKRILQDLSHSGHSANSGTVTANLHGNTVLKPLK